MKERKPRTAALVAIVATALSCSGGSSTPSAPAPGPSATAAVPSPSPAAPSNPASPAAASCRFGKGTPDTFCARRTPALLDDVDAAIEKLVQQHPEYFELTNLNGPGGYRVLKPTEYHRGVTANLQDAGFCAETDALTVSVRNGTEFSEEYDILLATSHVRRGSGSYRQTCTPPSFPLELADVISYVRVAFYSIRCPEGIAVPRNAEDKLPVGCTGFITATAKTKDNLDVNPNLVGNRIDWTFEQEGEHVRITDFPDVDFNKIAFAVDPGHYTLCAQIKAFKGCQFGEVVLPSSPTP
jgi:hypothetical protein